MSKTRLVGCCEVTINSALTRLSKLEGKNKLALASEFKEWINAIESDDNFRQIIETSRPEIGTDTSNAITVAAREVSES